MKKYYILAAAALSLAACSNDDNYVDDPVAAQITATIGQSSLSRASDTSWGTGDAIGVYMSGRYANIKYTTQEADGNFSGATIMYFKNKREPVTLTAYYPFNGTEGTTPEPLQAETTAANQTPEKQLKFDFLFASKENVTGEQPEVKFNFAHTMSKLTFVFKNGTGADVGKITSYSIEGLRLEGTFNTTTGVCAPKADAVVTPLSIDLLPGAVTDGVPLQSLIIFPQDVNNVTLKIKDSENQEYACSLTFADNKIKPGNNYHWTITVKKTGLSIDTSEINDWTTQKSDTGAGSVLPKK